MWDNILFGQEVYDIFYIFVLYSVFGWVYESCLVSIRKKTFVNRGFLNGPVIPIYGSGGLLIYLVFWHDRNNLMLVFFGSIVMATILEYVTSLVMELLFHARWWDYSRYHFNFQGRICLKASLLWGVLAVAMLQFVQPGMNRLIDDFPRKSAEIFGYIFIPFFVADIIFTTIYTFKFTALLTTIDKLRADMIEYLAATKLYETGGELRDRLVNLRLSGIFTELRRAIDYRAYKSVSNKENGKLEQRKIRSEVEIKMKEFLSRYQKLNMKKIHIRLIKAFPSMQSVRQDKALKDLKDTIGRKGVRILSKDLREEVSGTIKSYLSGFFRAFIVGILVLIQFGMIIYLSFKLREYTIYIYSIIEVLSMIIVIGLINDNRNSSYKISWICIIAVLPITGHIMFMLWGNQRRRKIDKRVLSIMQRGAQFYEYNQDILESFEQKYATKSRMAKYLEGNQFPLFKNNEITYYPMGENTFDAIFEEVEKAHRFILINFFIVGEGVLWERLHDLLLKKVKEGVEVLFLYDDFGAMFRTSNHFKKNLEHEGIKVRVFNPIHKYTDKLYMNYRSHQKIIVIDGNIGFTGGMNLADEYVNYVRRFGKWKDNAVKVEGDAVWGLTVTFLQMWEVASNGEQMDYECYRPTKEFKQNDVYCHVVSDGPANNPRNPVENIYKQLIYYAKKVLYITTPYLIIEDDMRDALIIAVKSGVDVRIITPFIPDKKHVKLLTNYHYGALLEAGVRIFEYTPGFIHAKTIINEETGIIGTINMDYRSFHLHYECGLWMCNDEIIHTIKEDLLDTMDQCHEVTLDEWKNRPFSVKMNQMILNLFKTMM